jgi:hypothetical protein
MQLFLFKMAVKITVPNVIPYGIREPGREFGLVVTATRKKPLPW